MDSILQSIGSLFGIYGWNDIIEIVLWLVVFLFAISCHEFMHGYVAYKMGDPTAKDAGRLSLNPARHFDLFSVIFFIIFRFGWAKGVPIDPRYFNNPKKGMVFSALGGPLTNLVLAFIGSILLQSLTLIPITMTDGAGIYVYFYTAMFFRGMVYVNTMLFIFNLIPIPPLDGSKIFLSFLPDRLYFKFLSYDRVMMIVLLVLIYFGSFTRLILNGTNNLIIILQNVAKFIIPS